MLLANYHRKDIKTYIQLPHCPLTNKLNTTFYNNVGKVTHTHQPKQPTGKLSSEYTLYSWKSVY